MTEEIGWTLLSIHLSNEFTIDEKRSIMYDHYQNIVDKSTTSIPDYMMTDIGLILVAGIIMEIIRCLK